MPTASFSTPEASETESFSNSGMPVGKFRMEISFVRLLNAINFPSGLSALAISGVLSPCRIRSIFPLFTSHKRIVLSLEIEINAFPSLENITWLTMKSCPSKFSSGVFEISGLMLQIKI